MYYLDSLARGGKERRFLELLKRVRERDFADVSIILMSRDIQYPEIRDFGYSIDFLLRRSRKDMRIFRDLYRLCLDVKPDIIHTWDSMTSVYAAPVAKLLGIRFVNGMITDSSYKNNIFERGWVRSKFTFPLSDVIVANSNAGLLAYRAPKRKSICVYNGFDPKRTENLPDAVDIKRQFLIDSPKVVGMVASFSERKDYRSFLSSAVEITRSQRDVTFIAVGDGPELETCKRMVPAEYIGKIKFLGMQRNVESIINIMDIGVLTTNTLVHGEGISNSIMEYMALGKPVVATDSGGTSEIIIDFGTGYIIPPSDVGILTEKIRILLSNNELAKRMGEAGRKRIYEFFTLDSMVEKYFTIYRSLVDQQGVKVS